MHIARRTGGAAHSEASSLTAAVAAAGAARRSAPLYPPPAPPHGYAPTSAHVHTPYGLQYPSNGTAPMYGGYHQPAAGQLPGLGVPPPLYSPQMYPQQPQQQYPQTAPLGIGTDLQVLLATLTGVGRQAAAVSAEEDPKAALSFEGQDLKVGLMEGSAPCPAAVYVSCHVFCAPCPCIVKPGARCCSLLCVALWAAEDCTWKDGGWLEMRLRAARVSRCCFSLRAASLWLRADSMAHCKAIRARRRCCPARDAHSHDDPKPTRTSQNDEVKSTRGRVTNDAPMLLRCQELGRALRA